MEVLKGPALYPDISHCGRDLYPNTTSLPRDCDSLPRDLYPNTTSLPRDCDSLPRDLYPKTGSLPQDSLPQDCNICLNIASCCTWVFV